MPEYPLHHIGVATRSIAEELPVFKSLGYAPASETFVDPAQKIRGLFITAPGQPTLELLENLEDHGPLDAALARGVKFYHLAYVVDDIEKALATMLYLEGARLIRPVTEAVCFKRICFIMLPNMLLVELVETGPSGSGGTGRTDQNGPEAG